MMRKMVAVMACVLAVLCVLGSLGCIFASFWTSQDLSNRLLATGMFGLFPTIGVCGIAAALGISAFD